MKSIVIPLAKGYDWEVHENNFKECDEKGIPFGSPIVRIPEGDFERCYFCYSGNIIGWRKIVGSVVDGYTKSSRKRGTYIETVGPLNLITPIPHKMRGAFNYIDLDENGTISNPIETEQEESTTLEVEASIIEQEENTLPEAKVPTEEPINTTEKNTIAQQNPTRQNNKPQYVSPNAQVKSEKPQVNFSSIQYANKENAKFKVVKPINLISGQSIPKDSIIYKTHGVYYLNGYLLDAAYQQDFNKLIMHEAIHGWNYIAPSQFTEYGI